MNTRVTTLLLQRHVPRGLDSNPSPASSTESPEASEVTSLSLGFPLCKIRVIIVPTLHSTLSLELGTQNRSMHGSYYYSYLGRGKSHGNQPQAIWRHVGNKGRVTNSIWVGVSLLLLESPASSPQEYLCSLPPDCTTSGKAFPSSLPRFSKPSNRGPFLPPHRTSNPGQYQNHLGNLVKIQRPRVSLLQ